MGPAPKFKITMTANFGTAVGEDSTAQFFGYVRNFAELLGAIPADKDTGGHFRIVHDEGGATARLHLVYQRPAQIGPIEKGLRGFANWAFDNRLAFAPRAELQIRREDGNTVSFVARVRPIDGQGRTSANTSAHYQHNYLRMSDRRLYHQIDKRLADWTEAATKACPDMAFGAFQMIIQHARHKPSGRAPGEA